MSKLQKSSLILVVGIFFITACTKVDQADQVQLIQATLHALETRTANLEGQETATPLDQQLLAIPTDTEQINDMQSPDKPIAEASHPLIAFTSLRDSTPYAVNQEIYLMKPDGSQQVNLSHHWAWDDAPTWSADGKKIAFWSDRDGNPEIYVMDANGDNVQRLTNNPAQDINPTWSPDGEKIAFVSDRNQRKEIFIMNADGSGQAQLTLMDNPVRAQDTLEFPVWSPDGTRLAFLAKSPNQAAGFIFLVNTDGSNESVVRDVSAAGRPAWSPDGKQLSFPGVRSSEVDDPTPEIYIVNLENNEFTRLTAPAMDAAPFWSPDGKSIVFESNRAAEQDYHHDLYLLTMQGALEQADPAWLKRLTTAEGRSPTWSPTGVTVDLEALAAAPVVQPAPLPVLTVCPSGCDYGSIQAAVDAVQPGVTVEVRSGDYAGKIDINKSLTLRGVDSGAGLPVLRQVGDDSIINITASQVVVESFHLVQIQETVSIEKAAIVVRSSHNTILGNTFEQCGMACILLQDANFNSIHKNIFGEEDANTAVAVQENPPSREGTPVGCWPQQAVAQPALGIVERFTIILQKASYNQVTGNYGQQLYTQISSGTMSPGGSNNQASEYKSSHQNLVIGNTSKVILEFSVSDNIISNNQGAIEITGAYLNTIGRNQIRQAEVGIAVMQNSWLNLFAYNLVDGSEIGICLWYTALSLFYANSVTNSTSYGIVLASAMPGNTQQEFMPNNYLNVFYLNILVENQVNAYDDYLPDYWDKISAGRGEQFRNRWYSGGSGNYYSSFDEMREGCQDANGDMLCDTGYPIPGGETIDPYPFMNRPDLQ